MEVWSKLVNSKYLKEADACIKGERCKKCNSGRQCYNHFCLLCMKGSLCPQEFKPSQAHHNHPWLQVHLAMKEPTVHTDDLKHFIGLKSTKLIQYYVEQKKTKHCYLRTQVFKQKLSGAQLLKLKGCAACQNSIKRSHRSKEAHLVCSLECLIQFAIDHPTLQLLEMEDGVMGVMKPPLLQAEKQCYHKLFNNRVPVTRSTALATTSIPTNLLEIPDIEAHEAAATMAAWNLPELPELEAHATKATLAAFYLPGGHEIEVPAPTATLAAFYLPGGHEIEAPAPTATLAAWNLPELPELEAHATKATLAAFYLPGGHEIEAPPPTTTLATQSLSEVPEIEAPATSTATTATLAAWNLPELPELEAPAPTAATTSEGFADMLTQEIARVVEEQGFDISMFLGDDRS